jgi:hypothetical protein
LREEHVQPRLAIHLIVLERLVRECPARVADDLCAEMPIGGGEQAPRHSAIRDLPLLAGEPSRPVGGEGHVRQLDADARRNAKGARGQLAIALRHDRAGLEPRRDLCRRSLRNE